MTDDEQARLTQTIIAGLPGRMTDSYDMRRFRDALAAYDGVDRSVLQRNLDYFLERVVPFAERSGVRLAIHPDDPPWSLFGLPRVVCNADDLSRIFARNTSKANGLALCAGTFGSDIANDVPEMARAFQDRIHYAHLRNLEHDKSEPRSFTETAHLEGDVNLIEVVRTLLRHEKHARRRGDGDRNIYFRPDHGHQMLDDVNKNINPGYSMIGRLKGLAEMRGVIRALESTER